MLLGHRHNRTALQLRKTEYIVFLSLMLTNIHVNRGHVVLDGKIVKICCSATSSIKKIQYVRIGKSSYSVPSSTVFSACHFISASVISGIGAKKKRIARKLYLR